MVIRRDEVASSSVASMSDRMSSLELDEWCHSANSWINKRLKELVAPVEGGCTSLTEAMSYSLLSGGKRVRPMLVLLTAAHFGRDINRFVDFGCALELVHSASLILDDLPCMDDASLRRGQATCHIQYGEATASLAAIALLNQAYGLISREQQIPAETRCALIDQLAAAIGSSGLVSGQCRDLLERQEELNFEQLRSINHQKTGVLFELAVVGSATLINLAPSQLASLRQYAWHLGQAFQFADDLLESTKYSSGSGKNSSADQNKSGSVHALGEQKLKQQLNEELEAGRHVLPSGQGAQAEWLHVYVEKLFARFV